MSNDQWFTIGAGGGGGGVCSGGGGGGNYNAQHQRQVEEYARQCNAHQQNQMMQNYANQLSFQALLPHDIANNLILLLLET